MKSTHTGGSGLHLSDHDRTRLELMLRSVSVARKKGSVGCLEARLKAPDTGEADSFPSNVVTLNTRFQLRDMSSDARHVYRLALPMLSERPPDPERLSIMDPIGASCLGSAVGDVVDCETPTGRVRFIVEEILFQPGLE